MLGRLNEVGLIDDAAFAELWVRSRHTYQGMARRALSIELRRKGVADEMVAEAVSAVDLEPRRPEPANWSANACAAWCRPTRWPGSGAWSACWPARATPRAWPTAWSAIELRAAGTEADLLDDTLPD